MDYLARQRQLFDRSKLDEVFPVKLYDPEYSLFYIAGDNNQSYLGASWLCAPVSGVDEQASTNLKTLISNDYPDDTILSTHLLSTTFISHHLNTFYRARLPVMQDTSNPEKADIVRNYVDRRIRLFKQGIEKPLDSTTKVLLKDFTLVFDLKIPTSKIPTEEEFQKISTYVASFQSTLETLKVNPQKMNAEDYLIIMRMILNPTSYPNTKIDPNKELNEQIFDFDSYVEVREKEVVVNDLFFRSMSVQMYPEYAMLPSVSNLIGDVKGTTNQIRTPFVLSSHIHLPPNAKTREASKGKASKLKAQADGKFGRKFPRIVRKSDNMQLLMDSMEEGSRPVNLWTNLMLTASSVEELNEQSNRIKSFYEYNGYTLNTDRFIQGPSFQLQFPLAIVPEAVKLTSKFCSMTAEHAAELIPIIADWKGNGDGANNLFYTKRGQVVMYDPFDSNTSSNVTVFGISGGGKSVLCNDMCMGLYSRNAMVRIIDSGGSYEKVTENIGGEYIDFSTRNNIVINPFTNIEDIHKEYPMLAMILEYMAAPKTGLSDYELSQLQKYTLQAFREYGNDLDITILSELIERQAAKENDRKCVQMAKQFFPYTRHGIYGTYFHGEANLTMRGDWSCLELDGLQDDPQLRMIVLIMMVLRLKQDFIGKNRHRMGIFLIDEFWKFADLNNDDKKTPDPGTLKVIQFIEEAFRVFRKHNKSCVVSTQTMMDLGERSPLILNSETIILTKQRAEAIEYMRDQKLLSISDWEYDMLHTLQRHGSEYSDIYVYTTDRGAGFLRFVLDKYTQLVYSTKASEVERIKHYREKHGMSLPQAIDAVIKELENSEEAK